ncbi:hypothetical protein CHF27_013515 [Romboutsia maritimum]|uniref:YbbR-like domain-containing protein n=1 Tax=Romboutsia maritimum TaxID=2020948 RepID=A0A371IPM4_9FIRM|nr:CdaR family protein [Romboutsia maritimum]RDY22422.1 hypothetical protein CHF27_013515 [Romboutsia maritimum]
MINKFKNNTKIKTISILSAVVLWLYVMAIVDPKETKRFEDIPITIDNMKELDENNLVIYPKEELKTDIYLTGNLSSLQKVKKENIHVYGQINNPIEGDNPVEGTNRLYLKAIVDESVTYEFKTKVITLNLEKMVNENKQVEVILEGKLKDNIDNLNRSMKTVKVSGPRTLVKSVTKVVAILNADNEENDFSTKLNLIPINENGKKVEGVELEASSVTISASMLKQKEVPINLIYNNQNQEELNLDNYKLSQDKIVIKGKKEVIDKIDSINTKPLNLLDVDKNTVNQVLLEIPEGISYNTKIITIKSYKVKKITDEFTYGVGDIQIRNNENNMDVSKLKIPEDIKVNIDYINDNQKILKSDIVLYIDLSGNDEDKQTYDIKYETNYKLDSISINPTNVEIQQ